MGKKGAAKLYEGKHLLKNSVRLCLFCTKNYIPKKNVQKYCSRACAMQHISILIKNGTINTNVNNRGKAEIYFANMCIEHFGSNDVLCNAKIFEDKNGGLWDADIVIQSLKIAVLYDGIFHHKQVKKGMNLLQIKTRDYLKRKIILSNGYRYYTVVDTGRFNKTFVEGQFWLFIHKQKSKQYLLDICK